MAGGPSTPALAAAVSAAGGLGFLAAGYKSADDLQADIAATRKLTSAPIGVNVFLVARTPVDEGALADYAKAIEPEADRLGAALGDPQFDDDALAAKLDVLCRECPPIVSFTFGCPSRGIVERLHRHEIGVWVTVTEVDEGLLAADAGADALVAQGVEAGGHRASFEDVEGRGEIALLPLLRLLATATDLPLVASGGIVDGAGVAAVLAGGARAAQIGTAFMRCPEAATSAPLRDALTPARPDRADTRLHRPPSPRHRQCVHARTQPARTLGLSPDTPPHGPAASRGSSCRRRQRDQSLGRPGALVGRRPPGRRTRPPLERGRARRRRASSRASTRA